MSEHTPGPWLPIMAPSGNWDILAENGSFYFAVVRGPMDEAAIKANALLIASAPLGLELAEMVVAGFSWRVLQKKAREVLAVAKPEAVKGENLCDK